MKKKHLFFFIPILTFTGILSCQILFSLWADTKIKDSTKKENQYARYEEGLKKTSFKSIDDVDYNFSSIKAPVVILNFWASWCVPCLEEFPSLVKLQEKYSSEKIRVLAINSGEDSVRDILKIKKRFKLNFPIVVDEEEKFFNTFSVSVLPVSIIFHKGKVLSFSRGSKDFFSEKMIKMFDDLFNEEKV